MLIYAQNDCWQGLEHYKLLSLDFLVIFGLIAGFEHYKRRLAYQVMKSLIKDWLNTLTNIGSVDRSRTFARGLV